MELFDLILHSLSEHDGILHRHGVSLRVLGRLDLLEPDFVSTIQHRAELTRDYGDKILNVCLSYTSRDEITNAIRQTVTDCNIPPEARSNLVRDTSIKRPDDSCAPSSLSDGHDEKSANVGQPAVICPQHITSATLTDRMLTAGDPPLDLLIRTSGTRRLSDFLLWQCCEETQIIFPETLWPDFGVWQFCSAVREWRRGRQMIINERSKVCKDNCSKKLQILNLYTEGTPLPEFSCSVGSDPKDRQPPRQESSVDPKRCQGTSSLAGALECDPITAEKGQCIANADGSSHRACSMECKRQNHYIKHIRKEWYVHNCIPSVKKDTDKSHKAS